MAGAAFACSQNRTKENGHQRTLGLSLQNSREKNKITGRMLIKKIENRQQSGSRTDRVNGHALFSISWKKISDLHSRSNKARNVPSRRGCKGSLVTVCRSSCCISQEYHATTSHPRNPRLSSQRNYPSHLYASVKSFALSLFPEEDASLAAAKTRSSARASVLPRPSHAVFVSRRESNTSEIEIFTS